MTTTEPIVDLDARFSSKGASPRPWSEVISLIEQAEIFWLTTVRADGRPHVTPLPAMWCDGALHFCTGPEEQQAKNLAHEPRVVLTTGTDRIQTGTDIIVEGTAVRVTDDAMLEQLAAMWRDKLQWPFEVVDHGFREQQPDILDPAIEGHGIAHVFAVAPTKVLVFGKGEPFSQTAYRFADRSTS